MGSVEKGARQAVRTCLQIKKEEKTVIITDRETLKIALAIAYELPFGSIIKFFEMEGFGKRPINFPSQIAEALASADVGFYLAQDIEGELQTFRGPMLETVASNRNLRFAHMGGITTQIMQEGMCSNYRNVSQLSRSVHQKVHSAKRIDLIAPGGTNLSVEFSPDIKWVTCDGIIKAGNWDNLPGGEVFTCPARVNGILAIDGCLGDFFDKKYGSLKKTPALIRVLNSFASAPICANKNLENDLSEYLFTKGQNRSKVGEFALGTNAGIKEIIGRLIQDEKMPGVHLAFGDPYPEETGANWEADSHLDCVIRQPTVYVDGRMIMRDGEYLII